jgi:flagellar biosynthesis protein FliR
MEILLDDVFGLLTTMWFPFVRLSALLLAAPFFGARTVPVRARIALALVLTLVILPALPVIEALEVLSADWWLLLIQQVLIGIAMAVVLQVAMSGIVLAGQNVATAMGLGFAASIDPQNGIQAAVVGQIYLIFGTLIFLATDSHLLLLRALYESFTVYPVDIAAFDTEVLAQVLAFSGHMFETGLLISLPVLVGVLLINIGFGVMTKAAPQLNIFSIGFPMSMLGGFLLILVSLPSVFSAVEQMFMDVMSFVFVVFAGGN